MRLYAKIMHYDQKNYELRVEKIGLQKNSLQIVLFFPVLHIFPGVSQIAPYTKQFLSDSIQFTKFKSHWSDNV